MLSKHRKLTISLTLLMIVLSLTGTAALAQGDSAWVRFVHAIPGAAAVDVYTDGQLTVSNLDFGQATEYISIPGGQHQLTVTQTGITTPLWTQTITPNGGTALTLVASSFTEPVAFTGFEDVLDPLPLGKARLTAIHAIADAPSVDILLDDGRPVLPGLIYNQPAGTLDVPVFPYSMVVVPSGQTVDSALLTLDTLPLNTGSSYMLLIYGTAAAPQSLLLSAPALSDAGGAFVRFVHGVPGAPAVDVYVNDTLAATVTDPEGSSSATRYIAIPAGTYSVALRPTGTQQDLVTENVTVAGGDHVTAVALGSADDISVELLADDLSAIAPNQALVRVINAGASSISASLQDGTVIANGVSAGEASAVTPATPSFGEVILTGEDASTLNLPAMNFYGGVFYDILAYGAGAKPLEPIALAQGIASAPGAEAVVVAAAVTPTVEPVQDAQPPAATPTFPPAPTVAPVVSTTDNTLTGRVFNLDPNANLHLRQYPNSGALSLAVIPPGTAVTVNGREGELADIPLSATQIPEDYEYVDPVSLLEDERDDLEREATWLFVTFNTPDGGSIEAWTRADYIDVRNAAGEPVALRSLATVPGNTPGEANNTSVTSPGGRQDIVTVTVTNLSQGANLNVRRTPDSDAEVLAQLPLGTAAEFVGLKEDGEWIFLSYASPDGTTITGWSNTLYLTYQLNGEPTTTEILQEKNLLAVAADDERGAVTAGTGGIVVPTVDPIKDAIVAEVALDAGANLNLRRNPTEQSEILAPIPSGTRLAVTQRTGDGNWLNVTYEGQDGWIAARKDNALFVVLTLNGREVELLDVPIQEGDDDSARFTPTPTPIASPTPAAAG